MTFWQIVMKGKRHAEVLIYSVIGESFWGEETVDAKTFVREVMALDVDTISLRINSPGGNVFDGTAIYNALERHPASITAYIDGVAASMASVIPLVADKIIVAPNAYMMIHNPSCGAGGTAKDLRKAAEMLDKIEKVMVGVYSKRTGQPESAVRDAMAEETWFTADEAIAWGLADQMGSEAKDVAALAQFGPDALKKLKFEHPPAQLVAALAGTGAPKIGGSSGAPSSTTTDEEDTMDPKLAAIRDALGMPATATEDEVRARIKAQGLIDPTASDAGNGDGDNPPAPDPDPNEGDEGEGEGDDEDNEGDGFDETEPTDKPVDGKPDAVMVSPQVLAQLQADAKAGRKARAVQVKAERENIVEKAISEGRIMRSQKASFLAQMKQGGPVEQSARVLLTADPAKGGLAPGLVPVDEEIGTALDADAIDSGSAYDENLFPEVKARKAALAAAEATGANVYPLIAREG